MLQRVAFAQDKYTSKDVTVIMIYHFGVSDKPYTPIILSDRKLTSKELQEGLGINRSDSLALLVESETIPKTNLLKLFAATESFVSEMVYSGKVPPGIDGFIIALMKDGKRQNAYLTTKKTVNYLSLIEKSLNVKKYNNLNDRITSLKRRLTPLLTPGDK
jgi:hypothetical protein